jgi:predicted Holliday junction resolvase-like endonuclease
MPPIPTQPLLLALGGLCLFLLLVIALMKRRLDSLSERLAEEEARQKSLSTTYGRITEQWFPLMAEYPYDPQNFRFLGSPIDGVQFEEDRIILVEFKANRSRLSENQKRIKRLVEEGEVYWDEFHFTDEEG